MKVWASTIRGDWNLVCEYWMPADISNKSGLRFGTGYKPAGLARALESIMQHREAFLPGAAPGSDSMIQVHRPTEADRAAASKRESALLDWLAA